MNAPSQSRIPSPVHLLLFALMLVGFGLIQQRCSSENEMTTEVPNLPDVESRLAVQPAFETVDVEPETFQLDAQSGGIQTLASGTQIEVPAEALVDAAGNPVTGTVDFSFREFHDAADLLLSGITMKYDSAGVAYDFQTAGMMEIEASQNGQPVFIQNGKAVSISLATFTEEENYNLYYLDETTGEWAFNGNPQLGPNEAKEAALEALNTVMPTKPLQPKQLNPEEYTFDFAVDYSQVPELKAFKDIHWEYAGKTEKEDPLKNEWIFDLTWTRVEVKEKAGEGLYTLSLADDWGKTFETTVTPALAGRNYDQALAQFKQDLKAYQEAQSEVSAESQRLNLQANMLRTFQISEFGIYNCDRFLGRKNVLQFAANFEFDEGVDVDPKALTVYLVTGDNRSVIPFYPGTGMYSQQEFKCDPKQQNKLVAVIPGNQVAVYDEATFARTNLREAANAGQFTFKMKTIDQVIASEADLREALKI